MLIRDSYNCSLVLLFSFAIFDLNIFCINAGVKFFVNSLSDCERKGESWSVFLEGRKGNFYFI